MQIIKMLQLHHYIGLMMVVHLGAVFIAPAHGLVGESISWFMYAWSNRSAGLYHDCVRSELWARSRHTKTRLSGASSES